MFFQKRNIISFLKKYQFIYIKFSNESENLEPKKVFALIYLQSNSFQQRIFTLFMFSQVIIKYLLF